MDNMYIKGEDIPQYLEWAGMAYNEYYGQYYNVNTGEMYGTKLLLTEDDIIAIQRMAIWTITNGGDYDKTGTGLTQWFYITEDYSATYSAMSTKDKKRNTQAIDLYNFLVDSAEEGASLYTAENNYTISNIPVTVNTTKSTVETVKINSNYCLIGPIVIDKNNDSLYTITMTLTDNEGSEITSDNYTFTDANGDLLEDMALKDLIGREDGFYIKLPNASAEEVNINIDITHSVTNKNLWLSGTETTSEIQLDAEQPIGEISRDTETITTQFTTSLKQFDLALRKYITKINGTELTNTRVPQIDTDILETETTASYNHKKDPEIVKNGDIVTYKITIYNEGELNGYASEIIDQLPEGLKYTGGSIIASNKNTYSVTYNESSNKITFTNTTKTSLNAYVTNSLDSETLEFTCEVEATPDTDNDKILTNVAWISGAYDSESNMEITEVGDDRDSRPQTSPSVTSTDIEDFKGNSSNKNDLTDSAYHYEGEQDDDDFEKLVIEPEIEITVVKSWDDNNDQDGIRPASVEISLYANGTAVEGKTAILSDANDWEYTFTNLPLNSNGTAITYSVAETSQVEEYSTLASGSADTGFTITNIHTPDVIDIPVTKVWEDNNDQDGLRSESITVKLKNGNTTVETATLNEANSWTYTFTDLPKNSNGTEINYTVEEISVDGYTTEITGDEETGYTITNTHTPDVIDIPVTKVWKDNNDQDGIRPNSITVNLKNGDTTVETVTLNEANSWTHTFTDLPKNSNGTEIDYTIEEISVDGYTIETTGDVESGYTITNTHTPEVIDIPVTKVWEDNNNQDGIRPNSITVNLKNGNTTVETVTLNEANSWTYTFTDLPKKSNGTEINYTVEEISVDGYTTEITGDEETGYTITNTHTPEVIDIPVTKVWEDNDDQDGIRPKSITVNLKNGNTTVETVTLNEANSWTHTFTDLPKKTNGTEIDYTIEEISVDGYTIEITGDKTTGYTITNTHTPEVINIPVTKVWEDNNDQDGIRPESITVNLKNGNTTVETITLNEANSWTYTFTNLPKKSNGTEINYTIEEISVDGYTTEITGDKETGYTITNTHTPEVINIPVTKVWEDNDNQDGIRPNSITVKLKNGNTTVETITLNEANSWTYTFTNLPKNSKGTEIDYTIEEISVTGYTTNVAGDKTNGYTITNTHTPGTTEVLVTKIWEDNNNQDGIRPESITVNLKNGDTTVETVTLNETNNWKHTFTNLPKYSDGSEINYTVEEVIVENYTSEVTGNMTDGYKITNTHKIFDLALRKYITKVNGVNVANTRVPNIQESTLTTGTTATYKHRKDPVQVQTGDIVTYSITIYNEGEKAGYASQIIDQLPTGLKYKSGSIVTSKNEYTVTYDETTNIITFDIVNSATSLNAYTTGNLDSETIEIECEVIAEANDNTNQVLTNVAWISGAYDADSKKDITQVKDDTDSEPGTKPDVNKDNMNEYRGNESNQEELADNTYYYEGQQDDDDFEKVVIEPKINIPVTKVWEDSNDQDGIRPESITINLKKGNTTVETVTLNEANNWTYTFTDLPKNENGTEIEYKIEEIEVEGYTTEVTGNKETGYTITNTHTPEVINIPVTKKWEDSNNQDGIRPESITVNLKNGETTVETITLNATNNWKYTFTDLPKNSNGTEINYTVEEVTVEDYTSEITGNMTEGYTITNTHIPEVTSVKVTKVWDDANNQDGKRPTEITITLYANDQEVDGQTVKLNNTNSWTYTFTDLPKNQNGSEISYTVKETGIPQGYTSETTGDMVNGYTITNTYTPETISIPVTKVWNDNENQDGLRPTEITIQLYANSVAVDGKILTLNTGNSWTQTFENLPKYESGEIIEYTVKEAGVPTGYTSLTSGSMSAGYTITNTYTPGLTSVKVTKVWNDNNDQDGIRPDSVSVSLLADGEVAQTIELNESNDWQYIFTELPIKKDGQDIEYTIVENTQIEGYVTKITNDNVTSTSGEIQTASAPEFTITNTHETDEISITVNKEWQDENNYDGTRPTSVVVNIKNGETIVDTVTLSDENNWTHTFENLPAKENGEDINYTIEEIEPEGYTADIVDNGDNTYTITNTHIPEKTFDLALRKYIIKINNNELTTLGLETRVPNISETSLVNGTTANYRHRKDPVEVEENDIITYAITIYNEGEKAGYASQIIDQLPTGLIYSPSTTVISKEANGAEKNTYTATYESSTNKVTFDIVNTTENPAKELQPYEQGNLDSETIEIKCKVVYKAVAGEKNILTNVAWINEAFDVEDNKTITTKVGDDRDSEPGTKPNVNKDNMEDYKGNESNKNDLTDDTYHYEGEQDDDDFEKLYVKTFDLSLRKFITSVNGEKTETSREPVVDVTPLQDGTDTTAIYNHPKTPVSLKVGDTVIYTIRVYNEGEIDGYANEVKDYLPPYLEYVENSTINKKYGWSISEDGRIVTTTYLSDKEISAFNGATLDYEDLQIECKISNNAIPDERITNIAEISEYKYGDTIVDEDIDSGSDNINENLPEDEDLPDYKNDDENESYVPGNEDDDDFEKVYVKEFDLALRKFITQVQDEEITSRIPKAKDENGVISYEHPKDAITVHVGDVVIYTLRIFNEGEIDGYASEITDDIPEYLEYLPEDSTNVQYMWKMYDENGEETENVEDAVKVKTQYLSKENGENNLIKAYDGQTLYYRDIKIAFKVKDPNSNEYIITNYAQISDDTDEEGNEIKDKDSETDEWNEGEDDQDIENVKVEYFDLSILKFVSKVIIQENGTEKITETGYNGHENPEPVVKVELHKKKLDDVVVKFGYGITVTNEGDIAGYASEITDYVPEGLRFEATDNPNWTDEGNNVISTKQLENTLLQPGESKTIEVILTWINGSENLALKTNIVEISDDKNEYDVPDRDSTPDNKQDGEDDIDLAKVILAISTGATKTYITLTLGLLAVVAVGVGLIKKFVI